MSTSRKRARTAATVETVRRISSATSTPRPGPAFTPPMSIRSAPAATAASTALSAASSAYVVPRSKNESGVRFTIAMTAKSPGAKLRSPNRKIVTGSPSCRSARVPRFGAPRVPGSPRPGAHATIVTWVSSSY